MIRRCFLGVRTSAGDYVKQTDGGVIESGHTPAWVRRAARCLPSSGSEVTPRISTPPRGVSVGVSVPARLERTVFTGTGPRRGPPWDRMADATGLGRA